MILFLILAILASIFVMDLIGHLGRRKADAARTAAMKAAITHRLQQQVVIVENNYHHLLRLLERLEGAPVETSELEAEVLRRLEAITEAGALESEIGRRFQRLEAITITGDWL